MIDKSSAVPIYYQLKLLLQDRIKSGQYALGTHLPSERELCEEFSISRMTVRQAIQELANEGFLRKERGKGTFVTKPKIEQVLSVLTSFTQDMKSRNLQPGTELINFSVIHATERLADLLQITADTPVYEIVRLRLADNEPMAIETAYVPTVFCPDLQLQDVSGGSLYEVLRSKGNLQMHNAYQSMEASLATQAEAKLLRVKPKAPVLLIERFTDDVQGKRIEYVKSVYRGDRYKFAIRMLAE